MQKLKNLIQLINDIGKKHVTAFEKKLTKQKKELLLFQGIVSGTYQNDHSASKQLYEAPPEDNRYTILKARLEEKLVNYLVYLDLIEPASGKHRSMKSRCELQLYQARMLVRHSEYQISERILKKNLRTAKQYEFCDIAVESLEALQELYSEQGMFSSFEPYIEDFIQYQQILTAERTASLIYRQALQRLAQEKAGQEISNYVDHVTLKLQNLWKQHPSYTLFEYYYRLHVRQLQLSEGYNQLLVLTTFADEFVRDLRINNKRFDYKFNNTLRLYACLRTGELENGLQIARENVTLIDADSTVFISFYDSYFLLCLHSRNYTLAHDLFKQIDEKILLKKTKLAMPEKWYLYKAYLYWMVGLEKDIIILEDSKVKQVLPVSQRDKKGYNITILILQFCQYLYFNKWDLLSKKAENYKKYIERHFVSNALIRERLFFLLILLIIRHNFNYEQISKKASKLLLKLKHSTLPGESRVSAIEIVPYEYLWQRIKQVLLEIKENRR